MDVPSPALKTATVPATSPAIQPASLNNWLPAVTSYSSMILPNTSPLDNNYHIPLPPSPPGGLKSSYSDASFLAAKDFSSRAADLEYSSISNLLGGISSEFTNLFQEAPFEPSQDFISSSTVTTVDTPPNSDYSPAAASSYSTSSTSTSTKTDSPHSRPHPLPQPQPQPLSSFPTLQPILQPQSRQTAAATGLLTPSVYGTPEEVYSKVVTPYPYTKGYHALIAYLRVRFAKPQLMILAKSMAAYRPSFIATTKTLQEDDLIFMEKCFQRTLLEFQKFITSSGTPTVVWRRTGQIAAAGREFCILMGCEHTDLVRSTDPRFIMELMDDSSVMRYFDVFTTLAFGDSRGVIMTECTLLSPDGHRIRTACTWTVKRDVFDIPMMIVGNFLPILD